MLPRSLTILLLGVVLVACGSLDHTNPYDPSTSPSQQARATLSGAVSLEPSRPTAPSLAGVHVSIPGSSLSADTDASGAYAIAGVPPGTYALQAVATGYQTAVLTGIAVSLDDGNHTVAVPPLSLRLARGAVQGVVSSAAFGGLGSAPLSGAVVSLDGLPGAATTDDAGAFLLAGVPAGAYTLHVSRSGFLDKGGVPVSVGADAVAQAAAVAMDWDPGGVAGSVLLPGALTSAGVTVRVKGLTLVGSPFQATTTSAPDGTWGLEGLVPAGSYNLSFEHPSYALASSAVTVAPHATTDVAPVVLVRNTGAIAGQVALSAGAVTGFPVGNDFSGVVVTLSGPDEPVPATVTDATGAYLFTAVPVSATGAEYTVTASKQSFLPDQTGVVAVSNSTTTVPAVLTLEVNAGTLSGSAQLWDNANDAGANPSSAGVAIQVFGAAFNQTTFAVSPSPTSAASGAWSATVPPGSYDLVATSAGRTCATLPSVTVSEGAAVTVSTLARCVDAVPPSAVVLGAPTAPSNGLSGFTGVASVSVPIASPASDAVNFRGYQTAVGAAPDWSSATVTPGQPPSLTFTLPTSGGLPVDGTYTLWARAVDWAGNGGPAGSASVVLDSSPPPIPTITTTVQVVAAASAAVTISGAEGSPNFLQYEACTGTAPGAACGTTPSCVSPDALRATPASFAAPLTANARNCVWARARDRAGNVSDTAALEIVSDLTPPTPPVLTPAYDPLAVGLRAATVDFFVSGGPTDEPLGGSTPWLNVAWLEVDAGAGFVPLCPQAECHPGDTYQPCSTRCAAVCSDARLVCSPITGAAPFAIRVPLAVSSANDVAVRAVDLAGNVGSAFTQRVNTLGQAGILATGGGDYDDVRIKGSVVTWHGPSGIQLTDLGTNLRPDGGDASCVIADPTSAAEPNSQTLVTYLDGATSTLRVRRRGAAAAWCAGDGDTPIYTPAAGTTITHLGAAGERAAFVVETTATATYRLYVLEPGADGLLDGADAGPYLVATYAPPVQPMVAPVLGGKHLITWTWDSAAGTHAWNLISATGSDFSGPVTSQELVGVWGAALSADGSELVYGTVSGSTQNLTVCRPSAAGVYTPGGAGCVTRSYPVSRIVDVGSRIAIEGSHVIAVENGSPGYITEWNAGPDGVFQADGGDDTLVRSLPSTVTRASPSISSSGLLVYRNGYASDDGTQDLLYLDLSSLRWELAPAAQLQYPIVNGAGALFAEDVDNHRLVYRSGDGRTTTASDIHGDLSPYRGSAAADAANLVTRASSSLWVYPADANGQWFVTAPSPTQVYTAATGNWLHKLAVADGKAIAIERAGALWNPVVLEPGTGALAAAAAVEVISGTGITASSDGGAFGITRQHAFFNCLSTDHPGVTLLCVRDAGDDHVFGTLDDTGANGSYPLRHAPNASGGMAGAVVSSTSVHASGRRVAFAEGSRLYVLDAGLDLRFGTADDTEIDVGAFSGDERDFSFSGNYVAYLATAAPAGKQVFLVDLVSGGTRQATEHYSVKQEVVVDATGRVFWKDGLFATAGIFTRLP
jgi:hypothetical protein